MTFTRAEIALVQKLEAGELLQARTQAEKNYGHGAGADKALIKEQPMTLKAVTEKMLNEHMAIQDTPPSGGSHPAEAH